VLLTRDLQVVEERFGMSTRERPPGKGR
jgi:hypothetical protein